jgi:hypothetical protein
MCRHPTPLSAWATCGAIPEFIISGTNPQPKRFAASKPAAGISTRATSACWTGWLLPMPTVSALGPGRPRKDDVVLAATVRDPSACPYGVRRCGGEERRKGACAFGLERIGLLQPSLPFGLKPMLVASLLTVLMSRPHHRRHCPR